ncbi:hypothetical protein DOS78_00465 [Staphylococcus felis]|uniref:hypothetical protein n=1 Tax=Staphylococcus felis TaxID=46127 RepID=UPI000CD1646F|nr:hypothetical protein [Staphylococcus felis]AVP36093.1 hypothetical protein C7J90_03680 [Staphylococcus felis]PNZ35828.1 hypothetical protein CD143_05245 [Staphylococcus felis]QQB03936.1 hypothetical protein I6H71_03000 [Staphylococcus felis]REI01316.1 hypothetical protein DOS65_08015 [Staphylococcus felis]REI11649.1 hypothetical protein DOS73_10700 [Staphylococcus felis]
MYNINTSKIVKGSLAFVIASGIVFSPIGIDNDSEAAEANSSIVSKKSAGTISKINDSVARIDLNNWITYNVDENGIATIKDTRSGKTEQLPVTAKDKNGEDATLVYFEEDGKLGVQVVKQQQERRADKCIIGTVGGAIGGATTGGLGGAAVGTVTLPVVGTVSGGVVGTIGGGIGGASGGYVAGC